MISSRSQRNQGTGACFVTTRWSVVLSARGKAESAPEGDQALETLCRNYWPPIYAYVRRQGQSPHDAQDLTQEFFAHLLKSDFLSAVDQAKGRFRSFLLVSIKHFLINEWHKARAVKRGGGQVFIPIDMRAAESTWTLEIPAGDSADKLFDRRWAITLLERTMDGLRAEYQKEGRLALFDALKETLAGERNSIPYATLAQQLGSTEGAVKVAAHRLRQRYRDFLRAEIADTVASREDVDEELRHLFAALV